MSPHPVGLRVETSPRIHRIHVAIRFVLLLALGALGYSSIYWVLYLLLPALVALEILQKGGERYLNDDGPRVVRALRWWAGAQAYLWLLTDVLPTSGAGGAVELELSAAQPPTASSALLRLVTCVPALLVLGVLSLVASVVWVVGAVLILVREELPAAFADFLSMVLRYQVRLAAYHLSLVERYPSFERATTRTQSLA